MQTVSYGSRTAESQVITMLKVQNRECIRRISKKSLRAGKRRNMVLCLAIALTTILMTALFTIGGSMLRAMQDATMYQVGTKSHAGFKFLTMEQYEKLQKSRRIKALSYNVIVGFGENTELLKDYTEVRYTQPDAAKWSMAYPTTGRLPESKYEVALSTAVLQDLQVPCEIGSQVTLQIAVGQKHVEDTFTVCGFWEKPAATMANEVFVSREYQEEIAPAWQTQEDYREHMQEDDVSGSINPSLYFASAFNIEGQMRALKAECGFDDEVNDGVNWAYASATVDAGTVLLVSGILLLIMGSGYLIIYNIFYISVSADIRFYGLLKTIGTTNRQLKRIVHRQAWLLSCIGIPIGLVLGFGLSTVLLPVIVRGVVQIPCTVQANPLVFLLSALFAWITVWISCVKPCRFVSRISPIEAVRYTERSGEEKKKTRKTRNVTPFQMAWANVCRNRQKTAMVVLSISLSIIMLNVTVTVVKGLDMDKYLSSFAVTDFCVADQTVTNAFSAANEVEGVQAQDRAYLEQAAGIEAIGSVYMHESIQYFTGEKAKKLEEIFERNKEQLFREAREYYAANIYEQHCLPMHIYGVDQLPFDKMEIAEGNADWEKFQTGDYAIVSAFYTNGTEPYYQEGEKITVSFPDGTQKEYEVMAIGDVAYALGPEHSHGMDINVTLPSEEFLRQIPDCKGALKLAFNVREDALEQAQDYVEAYCEKSDNTLDFSSKLTYQASFEEMRRMYLMVGGAMSFVLALIGVLNFINLTVTSIQERRNELAILQSVGMTGRQLKKMLIGEGVYKILLTFGFVMTAGMAVGYGILFILTNEMWMFTYHFVIWPIFVCVPVFVLIAVAVPAICYQNDSKKTLVSRLREVN